VTQKTSGHSGPENDPVDAANAVQFSMKKNFQRTLFSIASSLALSLGTTFADDEKKPDADNSKRNEADRSGESQTPQDQSNTPEDLKITQGIRKAIIKDSSLTLTAKNVKIITSGGKVTLRGPVNTAEEKTKIETLAKTTAGNANVDNQLEVKAAK
jgi:hyperosmotically inducible protein